MDGTAEKSSGSPGSLGSEWSIAGVGDYDGNGTADILWRNTGTGAILVWLMAGTTRTASSSPGRLATAWQVAALSPYSCQNSNLCAILSTGNNVRANGPFGPGNPAPSATAGGALSPFIWSVGATTLAQNWAAQCNFAHNPDRGDYGENIFAAAGFSTPAPITGSEVVLSWAGEAADYTYSTNSCVAGDECGHYTQLVWRSTNTVGCAIQQCTTNSPFAAPFTDWAFAVCDYSPPGNFNAEQPY
jgi:hypothetical protein